MEQVVQHAPGVSEGQLVAVTQYNKEKLGFPVAVGRMAVDEGTLARAEQVDVKGKAVFVLHTWKDVLWEMGVSKGLDMPEPRAIEPASDVPTEEPENDAEHAQGTVNQASANGISAQPESKATEGAGPSSPPLTPEGMHVEFAGTM